MVSDKLLKALGKDTVEEMDSLDTAELKAIIVQANEAMQTVEQELEDNEEYQQLKQRVSDMSAGKKEVFKRQSAKIKYSLHRLTELGKMDSTALAEHALNRIKAQAKKAQAE